MESDHLSILVWFLYAITALIMLYVVWRQINKKTGVRVNVPSNSKPIRTEKSASGLQSDILKEGHGEGAQGGDQLTVEYVLWLGTGEKVDSSYNRGRPMVFKLGHREVIEGWDKALRGAKVGEKRKIIVPPKLAYGNSTRSDKIPPGSTLVFEVEIINRVPRK